MFGHFDRSYRPSALLSKLPLTGNVYKSNYQTKQTNLNYEQTLHFLKTL